MKVAILLAPGFEECEAFITYDVLHRANIDVGLISTTDDYKVTGGHGICVDANQLLNGNERYDLLILPGGMPGTINLKEDQRVIKMVQDHFYEDKLVAAICAAPIVLQEAGILDGKNLTSYPSPEFITTYKNATYKEELVVVDKNVITSQGPATTFEFAYTLVDLLGGDSKSLKEAMLYSKIK